MKIESDMLTGRLMTVEIEIAKKVKKYLSTHSLFRDSFVERPYHLMNLRSTDFGLVRVTGVFMGSCGFTFFGA